MSYLKIQVEYFSFIFYYYRNFILYLELNRMYIHN